RMTKKLELTDEQVKKVKSVLTDARKKTIGLRADARVAGIELREMVSQEAVDKAKIGAKVDEIAKIRGDLLRARTDAALAVREILTPEQMAKADGMLKRMMRGRRGRR
ncbi:MAG: periplasmic heavy metal sensor, partial [Deltaproteobacteria bacterium]|nr:periplasmic heavy metal sensor [Deltaproteobacteria bacterium]